MASLSLATLRISAPPITFAPRNDSLFLAPRVVSYRRGGRGSILTVVRVVDGGDSYFHMWKKAVARERKEKIQKLADSSKDVDNYSGDNGDDRDIIEKKTELFQKILEVPKEERDRIQTLQMTGRAAAAISAARSIRKDSGSSPATESSTKENDRTIEGQEKRSQNKSLIDNTRSGNYENAPGPDFWTWTPPPSTPVSDHKDGLQTARQTSENPFRSAPLLEKEQSVSYLSIPFESKAYETTRNLPPFQSVIKIDKTKTSETAVEKKIIEEEHNLEVEFSTHAAEAADALHISKELSSEGVTQDGTRWWRETGTEQRPDGVICRWTLIKGVSADQAVEWQEKFWEASDEFDYKELGSEKSGRDAFGNVWREYWRESMILECGLVRIEKTADKWGKNTKGEEWQEEWWEHYDASGKADKWAHKWCSIDPNTPLEPGHAHVWHEKWGEKYDGYGGSVKYTDKWAERWEGNGWAKWGDKWDDHFIPNGHGVKQGETWWQGKHGDRWNRTWGENHNGSGWVHKYGRSSSGEHWDTHVQQDTWYEGFPHFGFYHCFENSVQLRDVKKPSELSKEIEEPSELSDEVEEEQSEWSGE